MMSRITINLKKQSEMVDDDSSQWNIPIAYHGRSLSFAHSDSWRTSTNPNSRKKLVTSPVEQSEPFELSIMVNKEVTVT